MLRKNWIKLGGSILSGILLALSFPGFNFSTLIFISFVPFLFTLRNTSPKYAILLSWITGIVFFGISLSWVFNVSNFVEGILYKSGSILGCVLLVFYCAFYFIPFGLLASLCIRIINKKSVIKNVFIMFFLTIVWISSEYLRGIFFTGFPWNLLGISQYANPAMIQISSFGGVYLISGLIIWMNLGVFITFLQYVEEKNKRKYRPHYELIIGIIPLALSIGYGMNQLFSDNQDHEKFKVAVIQPNIPQNEKIENIRFSSIAKNLEDLSDSALRVADPDLLIWPETALSGVTTRYMRSNDDVINRIIKICPLLTGVIDVEIKKDEEINFYNASILFKEPLESTAVDDVYYKNHLVPFGEFVPLSNVFKFLAPLGANFKSGKETKIFQTKKSPLFSVLICFEDTIPSIATKAVKMGSECLINQTNDAWFDPSYQSLQHMAHAIFRCTENNVPMIRACNTGISCIIDSKGRIRQSLNTQTKGFMIANISIDKERTLTFYTKYGDIFSMMAVLISIILTIILYFKKEIRS